MFTDKFVINVADYFYRKKEAKYIERIKKIIKENHVDGFSCGERFLYFPKQSKNEYIEVRKQNNGFCCTLITTYSKERTIAYITFDEIYENRIYSLVINESDELYAKINKDYELCMTENEKK